MSLLTLRGRLQTKFISYLPMGLITLFFAGVGGVGYIELFGISIIAGLLLETFWGWMVEYQPGYLNFLFALVEFLLIANIAVFLHVPVSLTSAAFYYLTAWTITQLFLLYILPVWRLSWAEDGGKLW
jgi:hypothetical protein